MTTARSAYVLGGAITPFLGKGHPDFVWKGHADFGKRDNPTLEQTIDAAVQGALAATGVPAAEVERAWIGNFVGELFSSQGHLGAAVAGAAPGLRFKPILRVEGACASGGLAFASAVEAIAAGADICLVVGAEVQTTASARQGGDFLARASHYARQRDIDDFTFPALFARRTRAVHEATGLSGDDLAHVAVKAYANAHKNPLAHMKAVPMDFDTARQEGPRNAKFLANAEVRDYLKVSDCSQVSDGGAALILVSEDGLRRLGRSRAEATLVRALAVATDSLYEDRDPLRLETTAWAAQRAYATAGIGPGDIQVAEVHDCFTVTELLMMEALGFAGPGEARAMVRDGATAIEGRLPINTGGGLVGFGHPVGATGVKQILEVHRQLHGACGAYQVPRSLSTGLCANMGGDDKTAVVTILGRV